MMRGPLASSVSHSSSSSKEDENLDEGKKSQMHKKKNKDASRDATSPGDAPRASPMTPPAPILTSRGDTGNASMDADSTDGTGPSGDLSEVLVHDFACPSPNATPLKQPSKPNAPASELFDTDSVRDLKTLLPVTLDSIAIKLVGNPIKALGNRLTKSNGNLPTGFPEARDLTTDVQGGKIPVKGQSCFSRVDILNTDPFFYHDTHPVPPKHLLAALVPAPQRLLYGDGLPYPGFLRSFSLADLPNVEWGRLVWLVTFIMLPKFAPFQDEALFFSHRSTIENIVNMLGSAKKSNKRTTVWVAYESRSNVPAWSGPRSLIAESTWCRH